MLTSSSTAAACFSVWCRPSQFLRQARQSIASRGHVVKIIGGFTQETALIGMSRMARWFSVLCCAFVFLLLLQFLPSLAASSVDTVMVIGGITWATHRPLQSEPTAGNADISTLCKELPTSDLARTAHRWLRASMPSIFPVFFNGTDPNTNFPCATVAEEVQVFGNPSPAMYSLIPKNEILQVVSDDRLLCSASYAVPHVVFMLVLGGKSGMAHMCAIELFRGLWVPVDTHFHDFLLRNRLVAWSWGTWYRELLDVTAALRPDWAQHLAFVEPSKAKLSSVNITSVNISTPFLHILANDVVGNMPGVVLASFISLWAHFWGSGLQSLGPTQMTVGVVDGAAGSPFVTVMNDPLLRYMTVPVVKILPGVLYYAKEITFAPRGAVDAHEGCSFMFMRQFLVPTVVLRMRAALARSRVVLNDNNGTDAGVDDERPWWPPEFDSFIRNPPHSLAIIKSAGATTSWRMFNITPQFRRVCERVGYVFVSDTAPVDVRLYLVNHAKRLLIVWGGSVTAHSFIWGGGIGHGCLRTIDLFILMHPGYGHEWGSFFEHPLKVSGVDIYSRKANQDGLDVYYCPTNTADGGGINGEGPFGTAMSFTKVIRVEDLDMITENHVVVTESERSGKSWEPFCKPREKNAVLRGRTEYELNRTFVAAFASAMKDGR